MSLSAPRCLMPLALSLYFDLVRFGAALAVLLHHIWPLVFPRFPLPWPGHAAVVVFFVLSGYVISHAAHRVTETPRRFITHRAARILSVTVPALALSTCIAPWVSATELPNGGPLSQSAGEFFTRMVLNLVFVAQFWDLNAMVPFNAPYWSLNFEVAYYLLFGLWFYGTKSWRYYAVGAGALLIGPKILLMMPVWLMGVGVQRWQPRWTEATAAFWFVMTALLGGLFFYFGVSTKIHLNAAARWPVAWSHLSGANEFLGDSVLGLLVAVHFAAAGSLDRLSVCLAPVQRPIRFLASYTLSTYLYHMPLAALIGVAWGVWHPGLFLPLLVLGIGGLGHFTERRVHTVRAWLGRAFPATR